MADLDLDVSVGDLDSLVEVLRAQWVGEFRDRELHPRVGTLYISPDRSSIRLEIRFPLDVEAFKKLRELNWGARAQKL